MQFTKGHIALVLQPGHTLALTEVNKQVTKLIAASFRSNRSAALAAFRTRLLSQWEKNHRFSPGEEQVLNDMALYCAAMNITDRKKTAMVPALARTKPLDPYRYNDLLIRFLA